MSKYPKVRNRLSPDITEKVCHGCNQLRPIEEFGKDHRSRDLRTAWCRDCSGRRQKRSYRRAGSLEVRRAWEAKRYQAENREHLASQGKRRYDALRREVLAAYGDHCECCGEAQPEFLNVDHVLGRRHAAYADERARYLSGNGFYYYLKRRGFPQGIYRLLCSNCNFARCKYGYCPHDQLRVERSA